MNNDEYKTFPAFLRQYASYTVAIKGNSEKTVCEYLLDLRTFFRFYIMYKNGDFLPIDEFEKISISHLTESILKEINQQTIIEYLLYVKVERKNDTSARMRKLSAIKSFFKYAYARMHWIDSNPATDIESPKKGTALPRYLTLDEAIRLLEVVRSDISSRTRIRDFAIITLFLNTGMRLSELVGLNLDSFDPDLTKVTVLGKGNKERIVYLNDAAKKAVMDYLRVRLDPKYVSTGDKAFFLSKRQTRISNKTVQWMVGKYLELAGLGGRGLSVHKLRHTAATLMYQSGKVDIRVLKDILGHEQLNTTQIYTHVVDRNIEEAVGNNPLAGVKISVKAPHEIIDEE
ncbi:MAG: tyrosine-type recombinase/integrase [Clostridia bacterium]|nr:tyrosine-type recombinase/integrase [Clostridia bacterium]